MMLCRRLWQVLVWLPAIITAVAGSIHERGEGAPTVTVSSGPVVGTTTLLLSGTAAVNKFLGIPFAATPERFAAPTDPTPWAEPLDATSFQAGCLQEFNYPLASQELMIEIFDTPPLEESEDCLYLNVYAPSTPAPASGRAVIFFLYGGNLEFGATQYYGYDGSSLAFNQDVVVVTSNYRTNVFGFPNSPALAYGSQNPGFLDQRKALAWTRANIAQFGGDPDKITLFGQSAGGLSVAQLVANPPSPIPFQGAIMDSLATLLPESGAGSWEGLVSALNCSACSTAAEQLACVRAAPASEITAIIDQGALLFPPVDDEVTSTAHLAAKFAASRTPLLLGSNGDDGSIFAIGVVLPVYSTVSDFLKGQFPTRPDLQLVLSRAYPVSEYGSQTAAISAIITDWKFQCPAKALADAGAISSPVWRYYFNATFSNIDGFAGASHGLELALIFDTYPTAGATDQEIALAKFTQGAWADFAKNPANGPSSGWPKVGSALADLANIGGNGSDSFYLMHPAQVDNKCLLFATVLNV